MQPAGGRGACGSRVAGQLVVNAIDGYDPSRGCEFAGYATPTIVGEIRRYSLGASPVPVDAPESRERLDVESVPDLVGLIQGTATGVDGCGRSIRVAQDDNVLGHSGAGTYLALGFGHWQAVEELHHLAEPRGDAVLIS